MGKKGNAVVVVIFVIFIGFALFLSVPIGGSLGLLREATVSFIFRKPPRFISIDVNIDGVTTEIKAGEPLKIKPKETIIITGVNANTFFDSYLTADISGFGKPNDLHEPVDTDEIRKQLIQAGIRSIPIDIYYIERNIAKVPLEMDLTEQDYLSRIKGVEDIEEKIGLLKNAHKNFPDNKGFLDMLDKILSKKGDYETLAGIYKGVIEADPDNMSAHAALSRYYIRLGLLKEAMDLNKEIDKRGRATATTYRRMAYIAGQFGDFVRRVRYLNKALELDKGNDSIILDLAKTYEQAGKKGKALEIYRSNAATSRDKEILIPVIEDALRKKDYKDAKGVLKRYIKLYPKDKNAYAQLGMIAGKLGNKKSQITYYKKAYDLSPKDPVVLHNLAVAYEQAGKTGKALSMYTKVLALKTKDKDAMRRAAALSLKEGAYRQAWGYYNALLKKGYKKEYVKGLISASVGMKDHDKIIQSCRRYLEKKKDYDVAITMAYAYETRAAGKKDQDKLKDLNSALDAYRLAFKINPKSQKAQEKIPELKIETLRLRKLY